MNQRIKVSNGWSFQALVNGSWAEGLLPDLYPINTLFSAVPDSRRVFTQDKSAGSSAADPRSVGSVGSAAYKTIPGSPDMFAKNVLTGGSSYTLASASSKIGFYLALALVGLGLYWLLKRK